ncbi:heparinase II/III family protein [Aquimarina algiphila]|uniref:heparinase II/III family protein n=1 Tax=Aquimarina algiphila TaxID=2047982 RepID=UPI0024937328|nr:heparinase II/III family protein [Aquimarina algiphila]
MTPLYKTVVCFLLLLILGMIGQAQIPTDRVLLNTELKNYLQEDLKTKLDSESDLAHYFRLKFSERFFSDWNNFSARLEDYNAMYTPLEQHRSRAEDHMGKFSATTKWQLPFTYSDEKEVNAYALRHLARQHKMVDIAFHYFNSNKDPKYLNYFLEQRNSLNEALANKKVETLDSGNGIYEVFRSGYRILNWLQIHNMFIGEESYDDKEQLITIATLLQHAADLYQNNSKFRAGNHQTRGMSALAMLSILFRDFKDADLWRERSMKRLKEHLDKEINPDGFQFERSVHYHISDIENYFYVYQLLKISDLKIDTLWEEKLKSLFISLIKIAYPDKTAPVLQDDTNIPWAEKNDISGAMTLGYLLFDDPVMGYFSKDKVASKIYWFLRKNQLESLKDIATQKPKFKSLALPETQYYVMRKGWNTKDQMMIISAGVDTEKPDHQHGDVLGVQAIANTQAILPNYQVRYPLKDLEIFKNSMTKNVALVDDELQGKKWTSNKGGSGFGKFKSLPTPKVIGWETNSDFDFFTGSHDGFSDLGVNYSRQVIYVKGDFWIVKDNFKANEEHSYKQVWQGHYTQEKSPNLLRAIYDDASGCDIYQINTIDSVEHGGTRGKNWNVAKAAPSKNFEFITLIYPYKGYNNRIDEEEVVPKIKKWSLHQTYYEVKGNKVTSISKGNEWYFFNLKSLKRKDLEITLDAESDIFIKENDRETTFYNLSDKEIKGKISRKSIQDFVLKPGAFLSLPK